jgi:sugar phosphate isomerase/epimerase
MWPTDFISRRSFLAAAAAASALPAAAKKKIPLGLELYSVRDVLPKDLFGVVKGVAKMGYEGVEFYSAYYAWKPDYAKEVRKLLDDLRIKCYSTHNDAKALATENLDKSIELNGILGSKIIVMASAGRVNGIDGWKKVAETLSAASARFKKAGIRAGFHNHATEFRPIDGVLPLEVLARNTPKDVTLQLDVGTCVEAGSDPVAWINQHPGRIHSIHCKDWSKDPAKGYRCLLGEGDSPWKKIFQAAEKKGGVEYYIVEQEGSAYPSMETAERCYQAFRKLHG